MWTLSHSQRFTLNGSEPSTSYEHLTLNEALSGIFGSISLAAWIFLLIPQLVENYRQQSADGISLAFLAVWFIGDIASLAGGLWANLVPTVIALSVYFCIADLVLVIQCLYYNKLNARHKLAQHDSTIDGPARKSSVHSRNSSSTAASSEDLEHQPLLSRRRSSDNLGLPGSHQRRRSSAVKKASAALLQQSGNSDNRSSDTSTVDGAAAVDFPDILEANDAGSHAWIKNSVSIVVICIAGVVGWFLAWRARVWRPTPVDGDDATVNMSFSAEALGYISALCYLGARIPQILKNQRDRSCEGLSLLFFLLSLLGNATYGAGILFHSLDRSYVLTNLPWLLGSLGTMAEDAVIFVQFRVFRKEEKGISSDMNDNSNNNNNDGGGGGDGGTFAG